MLDVKELKAEMIRNDYTQARLAAELGISTRTLYNKFKSGEFGTREMEIMMDCWPETAGHGPHAW